MILQSRPGFLRHVIRLINKFFELINRDGFLLASKRGFLYFLPNKQKVINKHRSDIASLLYKKLNGVVKYGPFSGLKLYHDTWWGNTDQSGMLLGFYEKEILESIISVPSTHKTFIDLGAADGYYGVGVLVNNLFDTSYCFEISGIGQKAIRDNAVLNNVSSRVNVFGIANNDFYEKIADKGVDISKCVLLCDIEGGEFELFNKKVLSALRGAIIFIEIHALFFEDGDLKYEKLKDDAELFYKITELTTGPRDPSVFPELEALSDNDRWLMCSEGRGKPGVWLRLDPK